jgi:N-acetylglutamate synthase-like GNAT family acetyltransferase
MTHIRDYTSSDRNYCIEVFKTNTPDFFDPSELPQFETWLDKEIKNELQGTSLYYYVLEKSGKVIGCGGFYLDPERNKAGMIWGMVSHAYHGSGFGRRLLEFRMQKIQSLSPQAQIMLDTSQHSCLFFKKIGFKITSVTKDFYGKDLDRYDMTYQCK